MNEIDDTLKTVKIGKPKNTNVGAIMQQMRDLALAQRQGGKDIDFSKATIKAMQEDSGCALSCFCDDALVAAIPMLGISVWTHAVGVMNRFAAPYSWRPMQKGP